MSSPKARWSRFAGSGGGRGRGGGRAGGMGGSAWHAGSLVPAPSRSSPGSSRRGRPASAGGGVRRHEPQQRPVTELELLGHRQVRHPSTIANASRTSTPARSRRPAAVLDGSTFPSDPARSPATRSDLCDPCTGATGPPPHTRSASSRQPPPTADGATRHAQIAVKVPGSLLWMRPRLSHPCRSIALFCFRGVRSPNSAVRQS
jgi:hypothetical protein